MKLQDSFSLGMKKNSKGMYSGKLFTSNSLKTNLLVIAAIEFVIILLLISINSGENLHLMDYLAISLLITFFFFTWLISKIIYKNYCEGFRDKVSLTIELQRNKSLNANLVKMNGELKKLSLTDELTGIPNRRSLMNFLDTSFNGILKKNSQLSIIMIDIDYFKQFNDCLGHNEANKILISVAQEINSTCRNHLDHAARYGGDEFVFVALNTDENCINEIAELIRAKVKNIKVSSNANNIENISLSIGTSTIRMNKKHAFYDCLELADRALYTAKGKGRDCVVSSETFSYEYDIQKG